MARKHVSLEDDQEKKGEIDVLNGEGIKQDEMKLLEESIEVLKIYKLLQRMKNKDNLFIVLNYNITGISTIPV